ncbi:MAG TPA: hypothetical protein PLD88_02060, partial [Candidatus Berkiella sp.]|nr:hypothetical protein [Candidatus Berkiella sp.]
RLKSPSLQPLFSAFKGDTTLNASREQNEKPTAIMNVPQLPSRALYEKLTSLKEMNELSHFGIKDFRLRDDPSKLGTGPVHLTMNMYSTADKSENAKTTQVHAKTEPNTKGITYSIDRNQLPDEKQQTIEQLCKLAVATSRPGTEFKITIKEPERTMTQTALDSALSAKYPNRYVKGEFKVPAISNCLQHANQFYQENNLAELAQLAQLALRHHEMGAHGDKSWKLQNNDEIQIMNFIINKALAKSNEQVHGYDTLKSQQQSFND